MGIAQLGFITTYLSDPLVSGFTTGAACHVFTSQIIHVFGISTQRYNELRAIMGIISVSIFTTVVILYKSLREDHNFFLYWYHKCDCILTGKYITSCNNCKSTQKRVWYLHKSILEDHYIFVYWYQKHETDIIPIIALSSWWRTFKKNRIWKVILFISLKNILRLKINEIFLCKYITSCNNCKSTQKRVWYLHKSILEDHYIFVYWYQKHV
jgi:hypothetical protein